MLSGVPERQSLVSCRLEDWANPNATITFRNHYLQVFFRGFFWIPTVLHNQLQPRSTRDTTSREALGM